MCKEMRVIPVKKVVDPKRMIRKNGVLRRRRVADPIKRPIGKNFAPSGHPGSQRRQPEPPCDTVVKMSDLDVQTSTPFRPEAFSGGQGQLAIMLVKPLPETRKISFSI
jgi:hypothetical protein